MVHQPQRNQICQILVHRPKFSSVSVIFQQFYFEFSTITKRILRGAPTFKFFVFQSFFSSKLFFPVGSKPKMSKIWCIDSNFLLFQPFLSNFLRISIKMSIHGASTFQFFDFQSFFSPQKSLFSIPHFLSHLH